MSYVTAKQRVLLSQYQAKEASEITTLKTTAFYLGVIRGARKRIKQIKRIVNADTPIEEARRLYAEAVMLQEQVNRASRVLSLSKGEAINAD